MRVPVYEVKVNGKAEDVKEVAISHPPKSYVFEARFTAGRKLNLGDLVEISFFNVPLVRGKITKKIVRHEKTEYVVSLRLPKIARTYIANNIPQRREAKVNRQFIAGKNAVELFSSILAELGYSLYVDEIPPLKCYGREVEGNVVQIVANYFRDFAPIIYVDSITKTVYLLFNALPRTWNIPDKAIFSYSVVEEDRNIRHFLVTNGKNPAEQKQEKQEQEEQEQGQEKKQEEECNAEAFAVTTSSRTRNSETINTYIVDPKKGKVKLVESTTIQYGPLPRRYIPGKTLTYMDFINQAPAYGVVSITTSTYGDNVSSTATYGWAQTGFTIVPTVGVGAGSFVVGDVAAFVPVYNFTLLSSSTSYEQKGEKEIGCGYVLETRSRVTYTTEYIYMPQEGGYLSRRDALKYVNLLPGDGITKTETHVSVSESISLKKKQKVNGKEYVFSVSQVHTEVDSEIDGPYGRTKVNTVTVKNEFSLPPIYVIAPVDGGEVSATTSTTTPNSTDTEEPFRSLSLKPYDAKIEHEDIDEETLEWAIQRGREMFKKHAIKATVEVPLLPVKVGERCTCLGRTWVVEGVSHRVNTSEATTTLYLREL
ncbi:MAG: hypothetical protein DSY42_07180 [Aquifex sp.]|nr:MAG: hypothetical protein DSY42_07180 [Aquifex sp.]